MQDLISRKAAIDAVHKTIYGFFDIVDDDSEEPFTKEEERFLVINKAITTRIKSLPSAQPERLTDDDFETIRIHLSACKEELCNQRRWEEAGEYQRIIDRLMAFASAQPEIVRCKDCRWWDKYNEKHGYCMAAKHGFMSSHWEISIYRTYDEDFFCADAEPKQEGAEDP